MFHLLFNHTANPIWLSLLRRGTGGLLLVSFILLWPDFYVLYGLSGVVDGDLLLLQRRAPGYAVYQLLGTVAEAGLSPGLALTALAFGYGVLCVLLCGWQSRPAAAALLVIHTVFFLAVPAFSYGFDYFAASALFYCAVFPAAPKAGTASAADLGSASLRVLQAHLCLVYFFGGLDKLLGSTWRSGEALWKAMSQPGFSGPLRPAAETLMDYPYLWVLAGWAVIALELAYAVCIWPAATRKVWLWATICLHLGIAWCMGLYSFSAMMILLNLVAFYFPYTPLRTPHSRHAGHPPSGAAVAGEGLVRAVRGAASPQEAVDV